MPNLRQTFLRAVVDKPSSSAASFCFTFWEWERAWASREEKKYAGDRELDKDGLCEGVFCKEGGRRNRNRERARKMGPAVSQNALQRPTCRFWEDFDAPACIQTHAYTQASRYGILCWCECASTVFVACTTCAMILSVEKERDRERDEDKERVRAREGKRGRWGLQEEVERERVCVRERESASRKGRRSMRGMKQI